MDDIARIDLEYEQRKKNLETFRLESLIKAVEQKFDEKLGCVLGQMQGYSERLTALENTNHPMSAKVDHSLNQIEGISERLTTMEDIQGRRTGIDLRQLQEELDNTKEALTEIRQERLPEVQQATQNLTRVNVQIQEELKQMSQTLDGIHPQQTQDEFNQARQRLNSVEEKMGDKIEQRDLAKVEHRVRKSIKQDIDRIYQYFCLTSAHDDLKKVLKQVEKSLRGQLKQAQQDLIDLGDRTRENMDQVDRSLSDENNQLLQELKQVQRSLEELQNQECTRPDPQKTNHVANRDPNHPVAKVRIDENGNAVSLQTQNEQIELVAGYGQVLNKPEEMTLKRSHNVVNLRDEIPSSVPILDAANKPRLILKASSSTQSTETVSSTNERCSPLELMIDGRIFTFSGSYLIKGNEIIIVPGNELPPKLVDATKALIKLAYTEDPGYVEERDGNCVLDVSAGQCCVHNQRDCDQNMESSSACKASCNKHVPTVFRTLEEGEITYFDVVALSMDLREVLGNPGPENMDFWIWPEDRGETMPELWADRYWSD